MGEERPGRETVALIRLHAVVEGQTEEAFVNQILAPELGRAGVFMDAHRITTGRRHGHLSRGGGSKYEQLARDLVLWMKQDDGEESWFTTMIDLYQLPADFPGKSAPAANLTPQGRVEMLEGELCRDIAGRLDHPVAKRLVPYVQLHELEALLFSDPASFAESFPEEGSAFDHLRAIRALFESPEHINEGSKTAPSRRITALLPDYEKTVSGILIAQRIGLAVMRRECRHFGEWIERLLGLGIDGSC